jgi:uncharacterized surface protein with fasciclin (FAS1) repeats
MIRNRNSATRAARVAFALTLAAAAPAAAQHAGHTAAGKNLVEVAVGAGSFNTLVAAVKAAGLAETLQGAGPFTVFAPTDAAFAKLPAGALDALLADRDALRKVLTLHVVPGRVLAADILRSNGATPRTVNGATVDVVVRDGKVYVNGAQVVSADVQASNGVIHVIDTVLLPAAAPAAK